MAKDTLNTKLNALYLLRAEQREHLEKIRAEQEKSRLLEQMKNWQILALTTIIILVLTIAVWMYRFQKKRRLENEQKLSVAEQKLLEAEQHLQTFRKTIAEKEKWIEKLSNTPENADELDKVLSAAILTEDDWKKFKTAFEIVYPAFFEKLQTVVSGISPAEIRLLALVKMKFSRKEIASTLGISPESIRVTWYRIRKKISGKNTVTMEEFVSEM
jgi:DNA-binding CsgD family transcriptional regulator/cbb3-type cytochrome oxidase subunit 3